MNKARRKFIQQIMDTLTDIKENIDLIREEEQESYDNLPESLQESERGEAVSSAIYNLEDAMEDIDLAIETLEESMQ